MNSNSNPKPPEPASLYLTAQMEITAAAEPVGDGKPALPRFSMVAYTGGPMRVAGWRHPVIVDLAGLAVPSQVRPIRVGHDADKRIGHTDSIAVQDGRLIAAGIVSCTTQHAREVVADARNGFPWQASIGAGVEQFEFVREGQTVLVNGREFTGPVNVVRKATLGEISFVDLGADGNTSASVAAHKETSFMDETITTATSASSSAGASDTPGGTDAAQGVQAGASAVTTQAEGALTSDPVADMRVRAAAEQQRIADVRKVCGDSHAEIAAQAIAEGWDVTRTELEILRADRPKAPAAHVPDNPVTSTVL